MKKLILTLLTIILVTPCLLAQITDGISYQAVAIDDKGKEIAGMDINGNILHSKEIGVRFTIIENNTEGTVLYQETQETYTDHNGLFSLVIGHGENTAMGLYSQLTDINWGADKLFLKVELDVKNRGNFKTMGIQQMMAVPFAFHAFNADNSSNTDEKDPIFSDWDKSTGISIKKSQVSDLGTYLETESDPVFEASVANGITGADTTNWNNKLDSYTESDPQFALSEANHITDAGSGIVISGSERTKLTNLTEEAEENVQSDWTETDNTLDAYILNKPTLASVATSGDFSDLTNIPADLADGDDNTQLTEAQVDAYADNNGYLKTESDPQFGLSEANNITDAGSGIVISSAERTKLTNLTEGAEINVQSNWTETDNTSDGYILNKPTLATVAISGSFADLANIPAGLADGDDNTQLTEAQVDAFADNNGYLKTESDPQFGLSEANNITDAGSGVVISSAERTKLTNLTEGAEENVQSDWTETDNTLDAYILNKPTLASVATSGSFDDLENTPTTVEDYGITNAVSKQDIQNGNLNYAVATGSSNTYEVILDPEPTLYTAGMIVNFKANFDNSGFATLNVNDLGEKPIKKLVTTDLDANDIKKNQMVSVIYDGVNFQLLNTPASLVYNNPTTSSHGDTLITTKGINKFIVPPGVRQIYIKLWGAPGGSSSYADWNYTSNFGNMKGGSGGYIYASIYVVPGEEFEIYLGSKGIDDCHFYNLGWERVSCGETRYLTTGTSGEMSYIKNKSSSKIIVRVDGGKAAGAPYYGRTSSSCSAYDENGSVGADGTVSVMSGEGVFPITKTTGGGQPSNNYCGVMYDAKIEIEW